MKTISKDEMIRAVRVVLDENKVTPMIDGLNAGDITQLSIDDIIADSIPRAVRYVMKYADAKYIENGTNGEDAEIHTAKTRDTEIWYGWVPMPEGFVRLLSAKMDSWDYPTYGIAPRGSDVYAMQHGHALCLVGSHDKPVATITPDGKRIELFPASDDEDGLDEFWYVAVPDDVEGYEIGDRLYPAAVYLCAALVSTTLGEIDKAKAMENIAVKYYSDDE